MFLKAFVAAAALSGAASGVSAATLDFVAAAAKNERGVPSGTVLSLDGMAVALTSSHFPYLDDLSGGKPAGLGVCKKLDRKAQCAPSSDDNVQFGEWVALGFASPVTIGGLEFWDAGHRTLQGSTGLLSIAVNGMSATTMTFGEAVARLFPAVSTITFTALSSKTGGREFYLGRAIATPMPAAHVPAPSPVPVPAAAGLLALGLGALGALRRRRAA